MKRGTALLFRAFNATPGGLIAQTAHELPTRRGYLVYIHNGLQFGGVAEAGLGQPQSAAHVAPIAAVARRLHGRRAPVRTQQTLGLERAAAVAARPAQPAALRYALDAVAGLVHAYVAAVAEHHLVVGLRIRRAAHVAHDRLVVFDVVVLQLVVEALEVFVRLGLEHLYEGLQLTALQPLLAHQHKLLVDEHEPVGVRLVVVVLGLACQCAIHELVGLVFCRVELRVLNRAHIFAWHLILLAACCCC